MQHDLCDTFQTAAMSAEVYSVAYAVWNSAPREQMGPQQAAVRGAHSYLIPLRF